MSTAPLNLLQIQQGSQKKIDEVYNDALKILANRSASLSDPFGQTTTINLPLKPRIFTIVSWNIQTFFAGKSLSNPYVNVIINRILEELDADVCMLLETREESYLNMNAIETDLRGNKKWKMIAGEEDEDENDEDDPPDPEEDDEEDEEDDDPQAADQQDFGGEPLRYLQIVSEMTGKKWYPPRRIYVYDKDKSDRFRAMADLAWLEKLKAKKTDPTAKDKKRKKQIKKRIEKKSSFYKKIKFKQLSKKEKGAAATFSASPKLFRNLCADPKSNLPIANWFELTKEGAHPFCHYYELRYLDKNFEEQEWTGNFSKVSPSDYWRFFFELAVCPACDNKIYKGSCTVCEPYGPSQPAFVNLRRIIDEISFYRCNCEESYSVLFRPDADVTSPSASGVWLRDKLVSVKSVAAHLLLHKPAVVKSKSKSSAATVVHAVGDLLQFSDKSCGFAGRSPFLLPFEIWLPYHDQGKFLHTVSFHGPFGAATIAGVKLRAQAMEELLLGAVGTEGRALKDTPHALVIGDFNLDWAPNEKSPVGTQRVAIELYDKLNSKGFKPMIPNGVATSLVSYHGKSKWKTLTGGTTSYTSSAYDNVFLKSTELAPFVANACVIDVIQWLVDHLTEFPLPDDDPQEGKIGSLSPTAQAFYIYHKYVSDHLPVLIDIAVAPMSEAAKSLHTSPLRQKEEKEALIRSGKVTQFDVAVTFQALVDVSDTPGFVDIYKVDNTGPTRQAIFCGVIDCHQDDHLIILCRPDQSQQGQRIWIALRLPIRNQRMLRSMLEGPYRPGMRIQFQVSDPRPH